MDGSPIIKREVVLVRNDNLPRIWPHWQPLLKRALRGNEDTYEPTDIYQAALQGMAQLWIQWSGRLEAFVVSELAVYPRGSWMRLWLAATNDDAEFDQDGFEEKLAEWKDANDCKGFEVIGRMGWLRRFPEARYIGVVMRT